jgi:hypothetical protein
VEFVLLAELFPPKMLPVVGTCTKFGVPEFAAG